MSKPIRAPKGRALSAVPATTSAPRASTGYSATANYPPAVGVTPSGAVKSRAVFRPRTAKNASVSLPGFSGADLVEVSVAEGATITVSAYQHGAVYSAITVLPFAGKVRARAEVDTRPAPAPLYSAHENELVPGDMAIADPMRARREKVAPLRPTRIPLYDQPSMVNAFEEEPGDTPLVTLDAFRATLDLAYAELTNGAPGSACRSLSLPLVFGLICSLCSRHWVPGPGLHMYVATAIDCPDVSSAEYYDALHSYPKEAYPEVVIREVCKQSLAARRAESHSEMHGAALRYPLHFSGMFAAEFAAAAITSVLLLGSASYDESSLRVAFPVAGFKASDSSAWAITWPACLARPVQTLAIGQSAAYGTYVESAELAYVFIVALAVASNAAGFKNAEESLAPAIQGARQAASRYLRSVPSRAIGEALLLETERTDLSRVVTSLPHPFSAVARIATTARGATLKSASAAAGLPPGYLAAVLSAFASRIGYHASQDRDPARASSPTAPKTLNDFYTQLRSVATVLENRPPPDI